MTLLEGIDIEKCVQSTVKLSAAGRVVYIDPFRIANAKDEADLILITHDHYDHCDPDSIGLLMKEDTVVTCPASGSSKISHIVVMQAGERKEEEGVGIEAVPAYNIGKPFHPKAKYLGYIITLAGKRIYHAGDTDRIPEMKAVGSIDIALVPVGGTYTMNAEEAAAAVNEDIKPKIAIPIHYGDVVGSVADAERFKKLCKCKVSIL